MKILQITAFSIVTTKLYQKVILKDDIKTVTQFPNIKSDFSNQLKYIKTFITDPHNAQVVEFCYDIVVTKYLKSLFAKYKLIQIFLDTLF